MSGFIYLWYDRKHKRYYLGKHWGSEDDGYICSSTWMKAAYKRRPEDFRRRRILERVTRREDLGPAEERWGLLMKPEELGKRYYNLKRPVANWQDDPERVNAARKKMTGRKFTEEHKRKISWKGKKHSEETKQHLSNVLKGRTHSEESKQKMRGWKHSEEAKQKMRGRTTVITEETKAKISATQKGRVFSEEHKQRLKEARRRRSEREAMSAN